MTPREMSAEELGAAKSKLETSWLGDTCKRVFAHLAAVQARAEAAEADSAVLLLHLRKIVHINPDASNEGYRWHTDADDVANHSGPHPGTGYRAKVRAELLREQAAEYRRLASLGTMNEYVYEAKATELEAQAAREDQG